MAKDIRVLLYYLYTQLKMQSNLLQTTWLSVNQSALKAVSESLTRELMEQFQVTTKQLKIYGLRS